MSKYDPLVAFLAGKNKDVVRVTFREIEDFLGFELPASKASRAWWSNNPDNSVMTRVWLKEGWRTKDINIDGEQVTFHRVDRKPDRDGLAAHARSAESLPQSLDLNRLSPVARNVLAVLSRRSGRSPADEALEILDETLSE